MSKLDGVKLTYTGGDACPTTGKPTQFSINMYCDPNMGWEDYDFSAGMLGDICSPYLDTVSRAACSRLSVSQLWDYLSKYSDYFGAFLLLAGVLLVFSGRLLLKPAVCFAGFLTTILVSCFIYYAVYFEDTSDVEDFWFFLGGGALVGIFVGLFACWCTRLGAAVLAGWGGLCGGLILYESFIYRADSQWLFWTTIVICAVAAAITAFIVLDEVVIVATVVLGSYSLVRGVACYAGHYYNEFTMAKMAEEGLLDDIDPWYWAYVGGFFLAVLIGTLVQCNTFKKQKAREAAKKHPYTAFMEGNKHVDDSETPHGRSNSMR